MHQYFKKKIIWVIFLFITSGLFFSISGRDSIQTIGDIFLVTTPLAALGTSYQMEDQEGRLMWSKSLGINALATFGLKQITKVERPDGSDNQSFPSAHTSMTFHSAAYIHLRYNLKLALPFYAASIFTAYSRVHANKHRTIDVLAGAIIGFGSAYSLTRKRKSSPDINYTYLFLGEEIDKKLLVFQFQTTF